MMYLEDELLCDRQFLMVLLPDLIVSFIPLIAPQQTRKSSTPYLSSTNPDGAIPGDPGGQQGGGLDDIAANEDDISAPGDDTLPPGEEDCRWSTVTLAVNQLYLSPEFHPNLHLLLPSLATRNSPISDPPERTRPGPTQHCLASGQSVAKPRHKEIPGSDHGHRNTWVTGNLNVLALADQICPVLIT